MKKKYFVFLILINFLFIYNVKADDSGGFGVCKNSTINGLYCNSKNVTITLGENDIFKKTYGGYFLRAGYTANSGNGDASAFCLDPGNPRPSGAVSLNYIRPINNTSSGSEDNVSKYDEGIYKIYQYFYNNLLYYKNNGGLNENNVNQNRVFFEYAIRTWTLKYGFGLEASSNMKDDLNKFKSCANKIDNNIAYDDNYTTSDNYCFDNYKSEIIKYYKYANSNYLWENPLKITTNVTKYTGNDNITYYKYEYNVSYSNGIYSFFDNTYSSGLSYKYLNLGSAEFYLEGFTANGTVIDSSNSYDFSGNSTVNSGDSSSFIVILSQKQFDNLKDANNKVNITMNYGYRHPMNIENLYVARYNTNNKYQRMLVIENFIHKESVTIGEETTISKCKHNGTSTFILSNGTSSNNINDFISSCTCNAVNESFLTANEYYIYENEYECNSGVLEENFYSDLKSCNNNDFIYANTYDQNNMSDDNYNDYQLIYKIKSNVNNYCIMTCTETININDLMGKFSTNAGTYFSFSKTPSVSATKKCDISVDKTKFETNYRNELEKMISAYNEWSDEKAASEATVTYGDCNPHSCNCSTGADGISHCNTCYDTSYTINYKYDFISIDSNNVSLKTSKKQESRYSCKTGLSFDVSGKLNNFTDYSINLINLQSNLKSCNYKLGLGYTYNISDSDYKENNIDDNIFYNFDVDLTFNYAQTIKDDDSETKFYNYNRALYGGIDDSHFDINSNINQSVKNDKASNIISFDYIKKENNSLNIYKKQIPYYNSLSRTVSWNSTFSVNFDKYTNVISAKNYNINDEKNDIEVNNKYDTSISAKISDNNDFYYLFSKLGDQSNNKIFNKYKDSNLNGIKRSCVYQITNDIFDENYSLKITFRIVDPNNIDPNNRIGSGKGMKNWTQGDADKINESDVFNPDNLEYSFTLDSNTIKIIKEYNDNNNYDDDSLYNCDDGSKCYSSFITELNKNNSSTLGTNSKIATNVGGRDNWKE